MARFMVKAREGWPEGPEVPPLTGRDVSTPWKDAVKHRKEESRRTRTDFSVTHVRKGGGWPLRQPSGTLSDLAECTVVQSVVTTSDKGARCNEGRSA